MQRVVNSLNNVVPLARNDDWPHFLRSFGVRFRAACVACNTRLSYPAERTSGKGRAQSQETPFSGRRSQNDFPGKKQGERPNVCFMRLRLS